MVKKGIFPEYYYRGNTIFFTCGYSHSREIRTITIINTADLLPTYRRNSITDCKILHCENQGDPLLRKNGQNIILLRVD
jgi:hypothetical protein